MKFIKLTALVICLALGLSACQKNELKQANAVAAEYSSMEFAAVDAESQILPVYADGSWLIDNDSEWIDVSPMTGYGNAEIVITVADNLSGKNVNLPRSAKIKFIGGSSDPNQNWTLTINQKGDKYFGKPELCVADFLDTEAGEDCKLLNVVVCAVADNGCVVTDESGYVFVSGINEDIVLGTKLTIGGQRSVVNGVPAMALDATLSPSEGSFDTPVAKDITADVDSYAPKFTEYVSVEGSIVGFTTEKILDDAILRIPGKSKEVALLDQTLTAERGELNYHKVVLEGYCVGVVDGSPALMITEVKEDKGIDESVIPITPVPGAQIFYDDFSWLVPIVTAYRAQAGGDDTVGDTVGTGNTGAAAPNIWNIEALSNVFGPAFAAKGYTDLNPEEKLCYLQPDYLKFSRTGGHNTALQLKVSTLPTAPTDVDITFEYCMMVQGDGTIDAGPVGVLLIGDGLFANGTKLSDGNVSAQTKGQFLWNKTAVMKAKGVTSRTKFVFLMHRVVTVDGALNVDDAGNPIFKWDVSGAGRFFIDNINIKVSGPDVDPVYADIKADADVLAFEGDGGEKIVKVTSDHEFVVESADEWITIENGEGEKDTETEVVVKAAASDLSKLREGTVTITSADSKKIIRVIQSAAGQDLDPFVSVGKNSVNVTSSAQELIVNVQATEAYTVTSDAEWVSVQPLTKATVQKSSETLYIAENTNTKASREAHVTFAIPEKGVESVLTITQAKGKDERFKVVFEDNFNWLSDMIKAFNDANEVPISDFVGGTYKDLTERVQTPTSNPAGKHQAPNAYTQTNLKDLFPAALAAAGYTDLNAGAKVIYPQDTYLKFGKTSAHTGLQFSPFKNVGEGTFEAELTFDWAVMLTGAFVADKVKILAVIDGDGVFANGTKRSDPVLTTMQDNADPAWQNTTFDMSGVTKDTKITIISEQGLESFTKSGAFRYFLDNIQVSAAKEGGSSVLELITNSPVEIDAAAQDVTLQFKTNIEYTHNLADFSSWITPKDIKTEGETVTVTLGVAANAGNDREAAIVVKNEEKAKEITLTIKQQGGAQKYLELVGKAITDDAFSVGREGAEIVAKYKTNVTPSVEGLPSWATIKGQTTQNDTTIVTITVAPNTTAKVRNAVVRVYNADVKNDILYYIAQDCTLPTGANVLFAENFDWMKEYYKEYADANSGKTFGDSVGKRDKDANSPNFYSAAGLDGLRTAFAAKGYGDSNASKKVIYPNDAYLKFGKTSTGTRLVLPALTVEGTVDATITFNYAFQVQGSGLVDPTELFVFVDGQKVNAEKLPTTQVGGDVNVDPRVVRDFTWQTATLELKGISKSSKIEIGNETLTITQRFFLDNIVIKKTGGAPDPETIEWGFNATEMTKYADNFGGTAGVASKAAGNGGMYVQSTVSGNGKIEYYQIDKTELDKDSKATRIVGSSGQPYVTGTWVGDYWLTSADLENTHPAGTKVKFHALSRCSGTGMRYWLIEYKDGNEWKPLLATKTEEIETKETITYNVKHENTAEFPIDATITLTSPTKRVEFRQTCVANAQASGKGALTAPNGGTHRYQGALAADGSTNTSTKIIVGVSE